MRRSLNIFFWSLFLLLVGGIVGVAWYFIHERSAPVFITLESETLTGPRDALILRFSQAIRPDSLTEKITLTPALPFTVEWHDWGKELVILPEENWPLERTLQLFVGQARTQLLARTEMASFQIAGPKYPEIVEMTPRNGATDVVLGVEDPIRVTLDRSAQNFFLDFRVEPELPVIYQTNPEKTIFEILPQANLEPGKTYNIHVFAKWRTAGDDSYRLLGETSFAVLPATPATWNRDLALRTAEAKRFTRPKHTEGKYIDINLGSQVMTLFENGKAIDAYIVSSGKAGMETPKGEFAIHNQAARPWSKRYSLYMPYWQAIVPSGLFGIHELPEWPGGYKEGANHLGTPVSHGCVRLGVGPAKRVFEWASIGTPVVIY